MKHLWSSKRTFILAAIGSAAGLGNLWRFPFQVYDNGGLIFLVVYFILLAVIGGGLLIGEIILGQWGQAGGPKTFGKLSKHRKRLGRAGGLTAVAIMSYYSVVIGWSLDYLRYSLVGLFQGGLPRAGQATDFFYGTVLTLSDGVANAGSWSIPVVIGLVVTQILVYRFTRNSAKSVGKVVRITATLPFVFLIMLLVRAVTLPGASLGFEFLLDADWNRLLDQTVWLAAAGQVFFSLSVGFTMMLAYASMKPRESEIVGSSLIILLGDTLTSLLSTGLVFGTLGFMATSQGVGVGEVSSGGPGLAFVTIPEALSQLPFAAPLFSLLFFGTVFCLAIDSAMAIIETMVIAIRDQTRWSNQKITARVCVVLAIISLIYARSNGLYLLDIVDHYINSYMIPFLAVMQALVLLLYRKNILTFLDTIHQGKRKCMHIVLPVCRVIIVGFLGYTLVINMLDGVLVYDSYPPSYLWGGLTVLIGIILSGIFLGYRISYEENKNEL